MKKILKLSSILVFLISIKCTKFDPGETNVKDFAGDWYYQVYATDGTLLEDYNYENNFRLYTYNTSSNNPNEIWIDDENKTFPLKAKFQIIGTANSFSGGYAVNEYIIKKPKVNNPNDGDTIDIGIYDFIIAELIEGKIMPKAATLWKDPQKAKADSIYLKIRFLSGTLHWIARKVIKENDTIVYYERANNFFTPDEVLDTFIIQGHRQTGWEVDFIE